MKKKIVVIGGSGFIGTRLVSLLIQNDKNEVVIADTKPSILFPNHYVYCDVRNFEKLMEAVRGASVVYNLAAEHRDDVMPLSLYYEVNVKGAEACVQACEQAGVQTLIFTSTVAVYGFCDNDGDESLPIAPFNPYGDSKAQAEEVYTRWVEADPDHRSLIIVRPTVVFGPDNRGNVYNLFRQLSSGFFPMIGSGKNKKSMAYVGNVASFLHYSLGFGPGCKIFNYADKSDLDMNSLVLLAKKALGRPPSVPFRLPYFIGLIGGYAFDALAWVTRRKFPISSIRIKKFCSSSQYSAKKAFASGFSPQTGLEEAIIETIQHEFGKREAARPTKLTSIPASPSIASSIEE